MNRACRSLFGPVDHEQLRRDLSQRLREITEEDSRRWNFDFHGHTPLPGRFQWEEVPAECAAAFYQRESREELKDKTNREGTGHGLCPSEEKSPLSNQENCARISNTRRCPAEVTPVCRKRTRAKSAVRPAQNNARITDFFSKRRRSTESKSVLTPFIFSTATEPPTCRTIR